MKLIWSGTEGWSCLIVFDSFDHPSKVNIRDYLPQKSDASVLITRRNLDTVTFGTLISLLRMQEHEGLELLLRYTKLDREDALVQKEVQCVLEKLDHLPLALDQAGAYIAARKLPLGIFDEEYDCSEKSLNAGIIEGVMTEKKGTKSL